MRFTPCFDWDRDVHSSLSNHRLARRDDTTTIGPQNHVDVNVELEITDWEQSTPDHDQIADHSRLDEADPEEGMFSEVQANEEKRASSLPPSLRELRKGNNKSVGLGVNEDTIAASTAAVQPDSRDRTEAPVNAEPETEHVEKQAALADIEEVVDVQSGSKHVQTPTTPADGEAPVKYHLETEHIETQATPPATEARINSGPRTEHAERSTTPAAEKEDDSDLVIIEVRPSPTLKRKPSASPPRRSAKKRTKHNNAAANSEEKGEEAPASNAARAQTLESEDDDGSEEETEDEEEDPQAAAKLAAAVKAFAGACRDCKKDANRALKHRYEREIARLKREHRDDRHDYKETADQKVRDSKRKATVDKRDMKSKHEGEIRSLKEAQEKKISNIKAKHDTAIEAWQEKHDDDEDMIKTLRKERDAVIAERKDIEQRSKAEVRLARRDLEAGERKLREERKQMVNETRQEVEQLKPAHSRIVKDNEKIIKEMTEHIINLEDKLKQTDCDLRNSQSDSAANKQRYSDCKNQLLQTQRQSSKAQDGLKAFDKYATNVEKRADSEVARLKTKLDREREDKRQLGERVIVMRRENLQLNDSVQKLSRLGREKREECERLRAELRATKAELGIAADLDVPEGLGNSRDPEAVRDT